MTSENGNKDHIVGCDNLEVENVIIKNIALVDGFRHNLFSVSQFYDKKYKVNFRTLDC